MFVEITRLFITLLATAIGFAIGERTAGLRGFDGAVLGATLGALAGYVAGGVSGRLIRRSVDTVEDRLDRTTAAQLLAGSIGAFALGGLGALLSLPALLLLPSTWGIPVLGLLTWVGMYLGWEVASRKSQELLGLAGLSTRPLVRATPYGKEGEPDAILLDTSAVLDGRLLAVVRAGFLRDALLVPQFVLDEVQGLADGTDPVRRRKGRRGLDVLDALQRAEGVQVHVLDDSVPELEEVDAKLVSLARRLKVSLCTLDGPLQRVAELQGVRCLNLGKLVDGLRPPHVPGEVLTVTISKAGKEPGQGVGYVDDGTMVVVGDAADKVGQEVTVRVTSNVSTALGPMLFAKVE